MSFINARGKLRPYTCVYTSEGERGQEKRRAEQKRRGRVEEKEYSAGERGGQGSREEAENDGGEVSIVLCFVPGGWARALPPHCYPYSSPSLTPVRARSLLLLLFFITIFAFPTFCFMLMAAACRYPLHQLLFPLDPSRSPSTARRPHSTPDGRRFVCMASGNF